MGVGRKWVSLCMIALLALSMAGIAMPAAAAQEGVDGDVYVSPTFGYSLAWDGDIWGVAEEFSEDGYDLLTLESDGAALYVEGVYFYQGDPDECLSGEVLRVADESGLDDLAPLEDVDGAEMVGDGDGYVYGLFALPSAEDDDLLDSAVYIECQTLVPNSVVLIFTGFLDPEDIDAQTFAVVEVIESLETDLLDVPEVDEADVEQIVRATGDDINAFWDDAFQQMGESYEVPLFITFTGPTESSCGDAFPGETGSFYCPDDLAVYLDVEDNLANDLSFGVVFFQVVLAHEIGHHVQTLLALDGCTERMCGEPGSSLAIELQADCFAGAWTQDAIGREIIAESDMVRVEAAMKTFMADPIDTPPDDPDAHGTGEERFAMYMAGFTDGLDACGIF